MKLKPLALISILIFTFCVPVSAWSDCKDKTIRCYKVSAYYYRENGIAKENTTVTFLGESKVGQCWKKTFLFFRKCMDCSDGDRENYARKKRACVASYPDSHEFNISVYASNEAVKKHFRFYSHPITFNF